MVPKICLIITSSMTAMQLILPHKHFGDLINILPLSVDVLATLFNVFLIINSKLLKYETNYYQIGKV